MTTLPVSDVAKSDIVMLTRCDSVTGRGVNGRNTPRS